MPSSVTDILLVLLLLFVLGYLYKVSKGLSQLKASKEDMGGLLKQLVVISDKADRNVERLEKTAKEVKTELDTSFERAEKLKKSVDTLNLASERIVEKITESVELGRSTLLGNQPRTGRLTAGNPGGVSPKAAPDRTSERQTPRPSASDEKVEPKASSGRPKTAGTRPASERPRLAAEDRSRSGSGRSIQDALGGDKDRATSKLLEIIEAQRIRA